MADWFTKQNSKLIAIGRYLNLISGLRHISGSIKGILSVLNTPTKALFVSLLDTRKVAYMPYFLGERSIYGCTGLATKYISCPCLYKAYWGGPG